MYVVSLRMVYDGPGTVNNLLSYFISNSTDTKWSCILHGFVYKESHEFVLNFRTVIKGSRQYNLYFNLD